MQVHPNIPASLGRDIYAALCTYLPPPAAETAEARIARDQRAMAAAIALRPTDPFQAELAAQIIAADFHAKDALAAASRPNLPFVALKNYRAQAALMARTAQAGVRELLRLQAADRAKHAEATETHAPTDAAPSPCAAEPAAIPPRDPVVHLSAAERYCMQHPGPATRIRAARGLPKRIDFNAPKREIVQAIVNGTAPIFRALDKPQRGKIAA